MKIKKVIIGSLLLCALQLQSQEVDWPCGEIVHGVVENIHFENCDKDILITVLNEGANTTIGGIIETTQKVFIKPGKGKVRIVPKSVTDHHHHRKQQTHRDKTKIGGEGGNRSTRKVNEILTLFPNPVTDELTIKTEETLISYRIVNAYGIISLQGTLLGVNTIAVNILPKGLYSLIIQTKKQILTKIFYKK